MAHRARSAIASQLTNAVGPFSFAVSPFNRPMCGKPGRNHHCATNRWFSLPERACRRLAYISVRSMSRPPTCSTTGPSTASNAGETRSACALRGFHEDPRLTRGTSRLGFSFDRRRDASTMRGEHVKAPCLFLDMSTSRRNDMPSTHVERREAGSRTRSSSRRRYGVDA